MKIFKLDIYQKDWLDIIFSERNQAYGAYELRKTASSSMYKAILAVVFGVGLMVVGLHVFGQKETSMPLSHEAGFEKEAFVVELDEQQEIIIPEVIETESAPQQLAADLPAEDLVRFPEAKVTDAARVTKELASKEDLRNKISARISINKVAHGTAIPTGDFGPEKKEGANTGVRKDGVENGVAGESSVPFVTVQVMPEPVGGMQAFIKWVAENYHFPDAALDNSVRGIIEVSFVVEIDGSLTDIKVVRDMGYGTGNEAVKLLKRAKKWNAGIQNGRAVRVAYRMPIRLSSVSQ